MEWDLLIRLLNSRLINRDWPCSGYVRYSLMISIGSLNVEMFDFLVAVIVMNREYHNRFKGVCIENGDWSLSVHVPVSEVQKLHHSARNMGSETTKLKHFDFRPIPLEEMMLPPFAEKSLHPILIENFSQLIRIDMIEGWRLDPVFPRIGEATRECGHHQFRSISLFVDHIAAHPEGPWNEFGFCKRCALYMLINLWSITKDGRQPTKFHVKPITHIIGIQQFQYGGIHESFLTFPLKHLQCSKLMFSHSQLWMLYIAQLMVHQASLQGIFQQISNEEIDLEEDGEIIHKSFGSLGMMMIECIRSLSMWRQEHWQIILSPMDTSRFDIWLNFIFDQWILYGIQSGLSGNGVLSRFHLSRCTGIKEKLDRKIVSSEYFQQRLNNWCKSVMITLQSTTISHYRHHQLIAAFGSPGNDRFVKRLDKMIRGMSMELHAMKWQEMQCQNAECSVKRKDKELWKCAKCRVVRYCSRKCQKKDHLSHKLDCNRIMQMRQARE